MKAVVKNVYVESKKRIIAISDIHGSLNLLVKLLDKVHYSEDDELIFVGDLIEKGPESLKTLRYIMKLSENKNVHIVSGNCDYIWEDVKSEIYGEELLKYMLRRKNSILNEMCREISIEVSESSDINYIKGELRKHYFSELNWLEQLPHIINTDNYIFVHAGISSEDLSEQDVEEVLSRDAFMEEGLTFSKYVVVGHWPTANYGRKIGCCNPIIDREHKIISIDGGNVIKTEGQLNALIINGQDIGFEAVDGFPRVRVIEDQAANSDTIQISWMDNAIVVIKEGEEFTLCRHISTGHELWIKNDKIFKAEDGMHCFDSTDYFVPVKCGDVVSVIEKAGKRTLVKKDGTIGWVENQKIE